MVKDLTSLSLSRPTLKLLRKYADIQHMTPNEFLTKLVNLFRYGLDGFETESVETLRQTYPYCDILVSADVRNLIGRPKDE